MKTNIRRSNLKKARLCGFLRRRRTKGGRTILATRRRLSKGKVKLKTADRRRRVRRGQNHKRGVKR